MTDEKRITIRVSHRFTASPERVFDAWLDPRTAPKFLFATDTGEIVRCDIDARVGGAFNIVDRREGKDVLHTGTYVEIERPRRLVFDFAVPEYSKEYTRVAIDIASRDSGCELTLTHDGVPEENASKSQGGWATILAALEKRIA